MTDPLSVTFAVAGIPGILTSFVDCFDYIQLGRKFGRDYEDSILKLELERLRLSRWGEKVHINLADPNYMQIQLELNSCSDTGRAREILTLVLDLFRDCEKVANRYRVKKIAVLAPTSSVARDEPVSFYQRARGLSMKQRQRGTSILKKTIWVLYDQKYLKELLKELGEMIEKLEEMFPAKGEESYSGMKPDREESNNKDHERLEISKQNCGSSDNDVSKPSKGHEYYNMKVEGNAQVYHGDLLTPGDSSRGRSHLYNNFVIGGNAKVRLGNVQTGGTALWIM